MCASAVHTSIVNFLYKKKSFWSLNFFVWSSKCFQYWLLITLQPDIRGFASKCSIFTLSKTQNWKSLTYDSFPVIMLHISINHIEHKTNKYCVYMKNIVKKHELHSTFFLVSWHAENGLSRKLLVQNCTEWYAKKHVSC